MGSDFVGIACAYAFFAHQGDIEHACEDRKNPRCRQVAFPAFAESATRIEFGVAAVIDEHEKYGEDDAEGAGHDGQHGQRSGGARESPLHFAALRTPQMTPEGGKAEERQEVVLAGGGPGYGLNVDRVSDPDEGNKEGKDSVVAALLGA